MPLIESAGLRLDILGYQYPEQDDCYWDGNWLEIDFHCAQPGRTSHFRDHCLRTDELKRFAEQLSALSTNQTDDASLDTMEPYLKWRILRRQHLLSIVEEAQDRASPNEFTFELQERDIPLLKAQIDAVLSDYPVRGLT